MLNQTVFLLCSSLDGFFVPALPHAVMSQRTPSAVLSCYMGTHSARSVTRRDATWSGSVLMTSLRRSLGLGTQFAVAVRPPTSGQFAAVWSASGPTRRPAAWPGRRLRVQRPSVQRTVTAKTTSRRIQTSNHSRRENTCVGKQTVNACC